MVVQTSLAKPGHKFDSNNQPARRGKKLPKPGNSFADRFPELLIRVDYLQTKHTLTEISWSSHKTVWLKCDKGHSFPYVPHTASSPDNCTVCSNKYVIERINDFASQNPVLMLEWDWGKNTVDPTKISSGYTKEVHWKCSKGHTWRAKVSERVHGGTGCGVCAGIKIWPGETDFLTLYPEKARYYHPTKNKKPLNEVAPHDSKTKYAWVCELGHEWNRAPESVTNHKGKTPCPVCNNFVLLIGFNDLETRYPLLACEWDEEANGYPSNKAKSWGMGKYHWKCVNGHKWYTYLNNRIYKGSGCGVCSNQILLVGFNDLATRRPDLALELDEPGVTAQELIFGANRTVRWKCASGHRWPATVSQRCHNNSGCMTCSNTNTSNVEAGLRREFEAQAVFDTLADGHNHVLSIPFRTKKSMRVDFCGTKNGRNIVVEYDSKRYHASDLKTEIDKDKTLALLAVGYSVLRIRHKGLNSLEINHPQYKELMGLDLHSANAYTFAANSVKNLLTEWL